MTEGTWDDCHLYPDDHTEADHAFPPDRVWTERLLRQAGFTVSGGGGAVDGTWDVFIENPEDPTREVGFSSIADARAYVETRRK